VSGPQCYFRPGVPKPSTVARGVGSCPGVSRTLTWVSPKAASSHARTHLPSLCSSRQPGSVDRSSVLQLTCVCMYQQQQRQIPARTQSGLMQTVCIDSATLTTKKLTRCFIFHVSKCRYCAQAGETLQSLADSFYTGLVLSWFSCPGYVWPRASVWCVMCANARTLNDKMLASFKEIELM
jgi:hypothetical protein